MKKTTAIIIGIASVVLIASLVLILIVFLPKLENDEKENLLKEKLTEMVSDYYENEFKVLMPSYLEQTGSLTVTLDSLQGMNKDISLFEEHSCDYTKTFAEVKKDGDSYVIEAHLDCEI